MSPVESEQLAGGSVGEVPAVLWLCGDQKDELGQEKGDLTSDSRQSLDSQQTHPGRLRNEMRKEPEERIQNTHWRGLRQRHLRIYQNCRKEVNRKSLTVGNIGRSITHTNQGALTGWSFAGQRWLWQMPFQPAGTG